MEQPSGDVENATLRPRQAAITPRNTPAPSATSTPGSQKRRKKPKKLFIKPIKKKLHSTAKGKEEVDSETVWQLGNPPIIGERKVKGNVQYLLNWSDIDPKTGVKYPPEWQSSQGGTCVSYSDIARWQKTIKKKGQVEIVFAGGQKQLLLREHPEIEAVSQRKRKRATESDDTSSQEEEPPQKVHRAGTTATARPQQVEEVKDSYEDEAESSVVPVPEYRVEVPVLQGLDRSAYALVELSQSSQASEFLSSTQGPQSSGFGSSSSPTFKTPRLPRRAFGDDPFVVPDSQEQPEGTYLPLGTQVTDTQHTIDQHTNTSSQLTSSESIDSVLAESQAQYTNSTYRVLPDSIRADASAEVPSTSRQGEILSQSSTEQSASKAPNTSQHPLQPSDSTLQQRPNSLVSSGTFISPSFGRRSWSEQERHVNSTEQQLHRFSSPEGPPSSSFPFQTQLNSGEEVDEGCGQPAEGFVLISEFDSLRAITAGQHSERVQGESEHTSDISLIPQSIALVQPRITTSQSSSTKTKYDSLPSPESSIFVTPEPQESVLPSIEQSSSPDFRRPSTPSGILQYPDSYGSNQPAQPSLTPHQSPTAHTMADRPKIVLSEASQARAAEFMKKAKEKAAAKRAASSTSSLPSSVPQSPLPPPVVNQPVSLRPVPAVPEPIRNGPPEVSLLGPPAKHAATNGTQHPFLDTAEESPLSNGAVQGAIPDVVMQTVIDAPLELQFQESSVQAMEPSIEPEDSDATTVRLTTNDPDEYFIPLPINSITRDIYTQVIKNYRSQRLAYLQSETLIPSLSNEINTMLTDLDLLCSHSDLISDDFSTQRQAPTELQARYAENLSTKCIFVAELLEGIRSCDEHVAILIRPGRMLEILEALLNYHNFHQQQDRPPIEYACDPELGALKVSLIPTAGRAPGFFASRPSVVIAFDSTYRDATYLGDLRNSERPSSNQAPLIHLVVRQSVEHLDLCFRDITHTRHRKHLLVRAVTLLVDEVGKLNKDEFDEPPQAAKLIAEWFLGARGEWPCSTMPDITNLDLSYPIHGSSATEVQDASDDAPPGASSTQPPYRSTKRQLEYEGAVGTESPKRQRLTPSPGDPMNTNPTYINNSSLPPLIDREDPVSAETEEAENDTQERESILLQKIFDLELELREKDASGVKARQRNLDLEARIRDLEESVKTIQPKYQEALNDRGQSEYDSKQSGTRFDSLKVKYEARGQEVEMWKRQKESADKALIDARVELAGSQVPEVAEFERLREEIRTLITDKERLERRKSNMSNDLDYMRQNYQMASSSASEALRDLSAAQEEIKSLRLQASERRVEIHRIQQSNEIAEYLGTITRLKAEREDLEREMDKMSTELAALKNGRRATRGTSVPQSPRMGQGTMSPGPGRNIAKVMQMGSRSRGASPAASELPGIGKAFSSMFGDPLPGARFKDHLQ